MVKRAILSVSDKTGIVELARRLAAQGVTLLSTGGTMKAIEEAGIPVTGVSDVTGFPECLDGRVKTLHPAIHAGLLAVRNNPEHMKQLEQLGVEPIDMVVINLYPFRATIEKPGVTFDEAIENIDIGGPTMLRAAAKNAQDVVVVIDPADYERVLNELEATGDVSLKTKRYLQYKVFEHTAQYDCMIQQYLRGQLEDAPAFPQNLTVTFEKVQEMRYGENPHQKAAFYRDLGDVAGTLPAAKQLHGKELSYNNINDTNGALELLREFDTTAVIAVKHGNPCGVGVADAVSEAYRLAYEADPVSVFGGIVVTNGTVDAATAEQMSKIFLEIIVAPKFTDEALAILDRFISSNPLETLTPCAAAADIRAAQGLIGTVHVSEPVRRYMVALVEKTRELPEVQTGVSPRGLLALLRACQSWAAMHGRDFVTPDDVKALSVPVLAHRIILGGLYGRSTKSEEVVREALSQIAAPVESGEGA